MLVFALLLVLALVSYSPLDPSFNTAATPPAGRPAHNWIGVFGAVASDLTLQVLGVAAFLIPVYLVMYSAPLVPLAADQFSLCQDASARWRC